MWSGVKALVAEIKKCEQAGATTAAVAMAYVCIDTMAYLSLPFGREVQGKAEFIAWTDTYLTGHKDQPYQYRGLDVYGARCALLHAFGSDTDFHEKNTDAKRYGYHDGGMHAFDAAFDNHRVIIGTASLINDVLHALTAFMEACQSDSDLRQRVESRLHKVLATFPVTLK
jgi:hypothetical protein